MKMHLQPLQRLTEKSEETSFACEDCKDPRAEHLKINFNVIEIGQSAMKMAKRGFIFR